MFADWVRLWLHRRSDRRWKRMVRRIDRRAVKRWIESDSHYLNRD